MNTTEDLSTKAKSLYWQAFSITQISKEIGVSINTIYSWRRRYEWDKATPMQRVQDRTHVRYLRLVERTTKPRRTSKKLTCWRASLTALNGMSDATREREEGEDPEKPFHRRTDNPASRPGL